MACSSEQVYEQVTSAYSSEQVSDNAGVVERISDTGGLDETGRWLQVQTDENGYPTHSRQPSTTTPQGLRSTSMSVHFADVLQKGSFGIVYDGNSHGQREDVATLSVDAATQAGCGISGGFDPSTLANHTEDAYCLAHPNIVHTFVYDQSRLSPPRYLTSREILEVWMMQDWCDRGSLSQYCNTPRYDDESVLEVLSIGVDISSACTYLHSQSIVHGDMNPDNVLLKSNRNNSKGYVCKLSGFGHNQVADGTGGAVPSRHITHTAPELFCETQPVKITPQVDVYSFGVIMWQALMGEKPYAGLSDAQIISQVSRGVRLTIDYAMRQDVRDLVYECTSPSPATRPVFQELLSRLLLGERLKAMAEERTRRIEDGVYKLLSTLDAGKFIQVGLASAAMNGVAADMASAAMQKP